MVILYILRAFYVSLIEIVIKLILRKITNRYGLFAFMAKEYKKEKKVESAKEFVDKYSSKVKGKMILFFIVQFLLSLLMGFYLSNFCYTYSNLLLVFSFLFCILLYLVAY